MIRLAALAAAATVGILTAADRFTAWLMATDATARAVVEGPAVTALAILGAAAVALATCTAGILFITARPSGRTAAPEDRA